MKQLPAFLVSLLIGITLILSGAPAGGSDITQPVTTLGTITSYGGTATAGLGMAFIARSARQVGQTSAISPSTLFTSGSSTALYQAHASIACTTTSAAATASVTILYTDTSGTAQSVTSAVAACTALGAASVNSLTLPFTAKNASAIQFSTAIVGTPTYDVRVTILQLTTN